VLFLSFHLLLVLNHERRNQVLSEFSAKGALVGSPIAAVPLVHSGLPGARGPGHGAWPDRLSVCLPCWQHFQL